MNQFHKQVRLPQALKIKTKETKTLPRQSSQNQHCKICSDIWYFPLITKMYLNKICLYRFFYRPNYATIQTVNVYTFSKRQYIYHSQKRYSHQSKFSNWNKRDNIETYIVNQQFFPTKLSLKKFKKITNIYKTQLKFSKKLAITIILIYIKVFLNSIQFSPFLPIIFLQSFDILQIKFLTQMMTKNLINGVVSLQ
eukprot:TRINITY_DN5275_c0_g1_i2.p1 TRINITY_DN5275_c0_g1~~TRINITY_DN5275_c0_g1_i2.p1  ORF type:complete len:195 (+),score=-19.81 TRINITY_DN5275_c0_g1_i2:459-1043(+)